MDTPTLRPLSTPELLDRTFSMYRNRFLLFASIIAVPSLLTLGLGLGRIAVAPNALTPSFGSTPQFAQIAAWLGWILVSLVGAMVVWMISTGATAIAVSAVHLERPITVSAALGAVMRRVPRLLGIVIAVTIALWGAMFVAIMLFGLATAAGGPPGALAGLLLVVFACGLVVFLALSWALSVPVAVLEDKGVRDSLSRSWQLARGSRWRVLLVAIIFIAVIFIVQLIVQVPVTIVLFGYLAASGAQPGIVPAWLQVVTIVVPVLSQCITGPLLTIALVLLYYDERVRKEGFDLELLMATVNGRTGDDAAGGRAGL